MHSLSSEDQSSILTSTCNPKKDDKNNEDVSLTCMDLLCRAVWLRYKTTRALDMQSDPKEVRGLKELTFLISMKKMMQLLQIFKTVSRRVS